MNRTHADWITPERLRVGGLVLLCLALFFLRLGGFALWDIDEGMHASTSKIMVQSGDWLAPVYNGEPFYDKPPLYNWFVALSFLVFGFTEFAARLPSALLGLGTVLLTYRFGRRMLGAEAAFLGAAVLATSLEFVVLSRILPDRSTSYLNAAFGQTVGRLVHSINGIPINALEDVSRAFEHPLDGFHVVRVEGEGTPLVLDAQASSARHHAILAQYDIPEDTRL